MIVIELKLEINLVEILTELLDWLEKHLLLWTNLLEAGLIISFGLLAWLINRKISSPVKLGLSKIPGLNKEKAVQLADKILLFCVWWILIWGYYLFGLSLELPVSLTSIAGNLLTAWLLIKIVSILVPGESLLVRLISYFIWTVAVLNILGLYDQVIGTLDDIVFVGGNIRLSLLAIIRGLLTFSILFWLSGRLHLLLKQQIRRKTSFSPSIKLLLYKTIRVLLIIIVILITLSSLGVKLSTFAFLGGAIGVGLGFGLQKIVSNYVSGIIILLDRSIKPGDIIEIDDVFGQVRAQKTRFVSMVTMTGKEYLIPNENFITQQVINWSYSTNRVRLDVSVGVSYQSDLRKVEKLILEAAEGVDRVLSNPEPDCLLKEFGGNTVNFELRFWINDPGQGVNNVRSKVLFAIWDNFARERIEIAFPQRDLHLSSISDSVMDNIKEITDKND